MANTRLVLIEGIMGSGKSMTAAYLADRLQQHGRRVRWHREYSPDNPILIDVDVLGGFDGTDDWRNPVKTLPQWQALGQLKRNDDSITILECKLWQNDALFMLLAGVPAAEVIASNQRVVHVLADASPVLIHLIHDDLEKHLQWVFEDRRELGGPHPPQTWAEWIVEIFVSSEFGRARGLEGYEGFLAGCHEWLRVCETMFGNFNGPKLEVWNPHADWDRAYRAIENLIGVPASTP